MPTDPHIDFGADLKVIATAMGQWFTRIPANFIGGCRGGYCAVVHENGGC